MKIKSLALIAAALLMLAGCSNTSGDQGTNFSESEQMFAQMMVPHHEQAIEMAELAQTRAEDPRVLEIAAKIKAGQEPEIQIMQGWVAESDGHGSHAGHGGMDGMLSEAELEELSQVSGAEFEKLFLEGMIKHHEGALAMLSMLEGSENQVVIDLREQIRVAQEAEIAEMKAFLENY